MKTQQQQTPLKSSNALRSSSTTKKHLKALKKDLNSAFASVSEDAALEISDESAAAAVAKSPISEIVDINQTVDSEETFSLVPGSANAALSDTVAMSELTTFSTNIEEKHDMNATASHYGSSSNLFIQYGSAEVDLASDLLRQAQAQLLRSADINQRSKKTLNALIQMTIQDLCRLAEEKDSFAKELGARIVILISLILALIFLIMFGIFGSQSSYRGPLPT